MKKTFILILTIYLLFSQSITHLFPAISGNYGELVPLNLSIKEGNGDIYINEKTKFGIDTQSSLENAVLFALKYENKTKEYDFYLKSDSKIKTIEGPSGGVLLSMMIISLLENKTLRNDTIISGTISKNGKIGNVGGLYEKILTAKINGFKYFLIPQQDIFYRILLKKLEDKEFKIIETNNISKIKKFIIDRQNIEDEIKKLKIKRKSINESFNWESKKFEKIAKYFIELQNKEFEKIDMNIKKTYGLNEYMENLSLIENDLLTNKYYFSAANLAFLNYIDFKTINDLKDMNLKRRRKEVINCIKSIKIPTISKDNLEYVAGAEIRKGWAMLEIKDEINNSLSEDEKLLYLRKIEYADAWCHVAKSLINDTNGGLGKEENLKDMAEYYLLSINESFWDNRHYKNALNLYKNKEYAGSIIESIYLIKTEIEKETNVKIQSKINLSNDWANAYYSHAKYILKEDNKTAKKLISYACELENRINEMKSLVKKSEKNKPNSFPLFVILALILGYGLGKIHIKRFIKK